MQDITFPAAATILRHCLGRRETRCGRAVRVPGALAFSPVADTVRAEIDAGIERAREGADREGKR
ncbi:MAG: hypothetical protein RID91_19600 [Azospirillaceae bacterium]